MIFAAASAGQLPPAGEATVGDVRLPRGRLITADPAFARTEPRASSVLWLAAQAPGKGIVSRLFDRAPKPDYSALAAVFPRTGLWPLLCDSLRGDSERPWESANWTPRARRRPRRTMPRR